MYQYKTYSAVSQIPRERWQRLADTDNPFLNYDFLNALETSGAVSHKTGWQPLHLEILDNTETLVLLPLYLKSHSWGEYVFDWSWANAYEEAGLAYYPKLLSAIPFTPSTGPRWLSRLPAPQALSLISKTIEQLTAAHQLSGYHLLFPDLQPNRELPDGWLQRSGHQYHWFNANYQSFEQFLESFTARKRKDVRKERRKVSEQGIEFQRRSGRELSDQQLDEFYRFYATTYLKRGQPPYLTERFFGQICETLGDQTLFILAYQQQRCIAGALFFHDATTLYGRYWGCEQEVDGLHFETCYYQGIEFAIERGLQRFDPGAQGEHKIKRGFRPVKTQSLHWIASAEFRNAIGNFLNEEEILVNQRICQLEAHLPFKAESGG